MFWGNNNHTYKKGCKNQYHLTTKPFPNGFSGIQFGLRGLNRNLLKLCHACLLNCKSNEDFFSFRCGNGEFSIGRTLPSKVYLSSSEDEDEDDYDEYDEDYLKIYSKKESPQTATTPCAEQEKEEYDELIRCQTLSTTSSCDKKYFKSMRSQSSAVGLECEVTVKCEKKGQEVKKLHTKLKCECDVIKDEQDHEQGGSVKLLCDEINKDMKRSGNGDIWKEDVGDGKPYCPITRTMKDKLSSELKKLTESGLSGEAIVCKAEETVDQVISRAQRTQMIAHDTLYPWILKKKEKESERVTEEDKESERVTEEDNESFLYKYDFEYLNKITENDSDTLSADSQQNSVDDESNKANVSEVIVNQAIIYLVDN